MSGVNVILLSRSLIVSLYHLSYDNHNYLHHVNITQNYVRYKVILVGPI